MFGEAKNLISALGDIAQAQYRGAGALFRIPTLILRGLRSDPQFNDLLEHVGDELNRVEQAIATETAVEELTKEWAAFQAHCLGRFGASEEDKEEECPE